MFIHNLQSCVKGNSSKFLYNKSHMAFNQTKYRFSKGISYPFLYSDVINKAKKLTSDTSKLVESLKTLFV